MNKHNYFLIMLYVFIASAVITLLATCEKIEFVVATGFISIIFLLMIGIIIYDNKS